MNSISTDMIYPMAALAIYTFLVVLRNLQVRVAAVKSGRLSNSYFKLMQHDDAPVEVMQTANHLRNLFEFPVLFYVVCLAITVTGLTDALFALLAWAYVGFRVLHGIVHLTTNNVMVRFAFFLVSTILLFTLWVRLLVILPA